VRLLTLVPPPPPPFSFSACVNACSIGRSSESCPRSRTPRSFATSDSCGAPRESLTGNARCTTRNAPLVFWWLISSHDPGRTYVHVHGSEMLYIYKTFLDNISTEEQVEEVRAVPITPFRASDSPFCVHTTWDDAVPGQPAVVAGRPLPGGRVAVPPVQGRA
jgi:hypothetical protein